MQNVADPNEQPAPVLMTKGAFFGAVFAVLGAFPAAALVGLVYRFPIPMAGYASGFEAIFPSVIAVIFYGVLGGFAILSVLGAIGGSIAYSLGMPNDRVKLKATLVVAFVIDLLAAIFMAILEWFIGPW